MILSVKQNSLLSLNYIYLQTVMLLKMDVVRQTVRRNIVSGILIFMDFCFMNVKPRI